MELRLAASKELRGDAFAGESAFLLAKALASLACSRSFARLVDDARESELITFGLAVVVVVVVVAAAVEAAAAGGVALRSSSDSARMLSKRDSTPATACCRNEPHRDACFPGALMV